MKIVRIDLGKADHDGTRDHLGTASLPAYRPQPLFSSNMTDYAYRRMSSLQQSISHYGSWFMASDMQTCNYRHSRKHVASGSDNEVGTAPAYGHATGTFR